MMSRHNMDTHQGNELTDSSSGNARPQSSQLAEPLWTDPGLKSGISVRMRGLPGGTLFNSWPTQ